MVDYVDIPKGWKLAAPQFWWGYPTKEDGHRNRRKTIRSEHAAVIGVIVWDNRIGDCEVLIHPGWEPDPEGTNMSLRDLISDAIGLLDRHLEYISQVENKKTGENNE